MDKVLIITGSSSGIGKAVAMQAANEGYSICINYHNSQMKAEQLTSSLMAMGTKAIAVKADIRSEQGVMQLFDAVDHQLGRITHLVNNAGIIAPIQPFEKISLNRLQDVFATNVFGSFLCAREAIKRMSTHNGGTGGVIVNVSSVAATLGSANEFIDYAASKGAIDTFTRGLAKEVATQGIRVNAVRPGLITTDLHAHAGDATRPDKYKALIPMQRPGSADEVANVITWLLSESASYLTGTLIDVSGGR